MRGDDQINVTNRPALEGEELVVHKFRNGLIRMVSRSDYSRWKISSQDGVSNGAVARVFRSLVNAFLRYLIAPGLLRCGCDPSPVIAVPADALLRVYGIDPDMQRQHGLDATEDALFVEITLLLGRSRDALCFGNGVVIPLQALPEGQRVRVLYRSWTENMSPALEPYQLGI
jgi:hypothetical protein